MFKQLKELISELTKYLKNKNDQTEPVWIDINELPRQLGVTLEERLETFTKLRKMGMVITNKPQQSV